MSIWADLEDIGYDLWRKRPRKVRGEVRAYAQGWSNHYPTNRVEAPACLTVAHVPSWCVPGHREEFDDYAGQWLRLFLSAPDARTWWMKNGEKGPQPEPLNAAVVMDETAVRALVDDLTKWLDMPKVHPRKAKP